MQLRTAFLSLLTLFFTADGFNHPEIQWKSVSTEHFTINYYDKTEPAVYATWKIAEETYSALAPLFNYSFQRKIELSLADYDDYSNGWADFSTSTIMIWLPDLNFDLRGSTTWLRNVLTHEITHILSLENKKKMQVMDISANIQLTTQSEQLAIREPFARITCYPGWFAEGIAQRESERMGHDCWDSRREMLLRTAVLSHKLLSLDEMSYFNHDLRYNEMVYNQGFSFVRFLEEKIGHSSLLSIFKAGGDGKIDFSFYFAELAGKSLQSFYTEWQDSLTQFYSVKFPVSSEKNVSIYKRGSFNTVPKISPDGKLWGWFSSGSDDGSRTDLIVCDNGKTDIKYRFPNAKTSWCFSRDSKKIYFVKSNEPDQNGSFLNDLFVFNTEKKTTNRLTKDARVYNVALSPVNGNIALVTCNSGVFSLSQFDEKTKSLSQMVKGKLGEPFIGCSWSPTDSTRIAVEKIVNGRSNIFIFFIADSVGHPLTPEQEGEFPDERMRPLSSGKTREESPFWAPDGRVYFNADYDGIFNIYSVKDNGSNLKRYSNTVGGYFSPFVKDSTIIVSTYGSTGFTIAQMANNGNSYEISSNDNCFFKPLPEPNGKVTINASPYIPHLGRPLWELSFFGSLSRNWGLFESKSSVTGGISTVQAGAAITCFRSDPLKKKALMIGAAIGTVNEKTTVDSSSNKNQLQQISGLLCKDGLKLSNSIGCKLNLKKKMNLKNIFLKNFCISII